MTITTILLAVFGARLVGAYTLRDLGAHQLVASFGCFVIRIVSFGRIRVKSADDDVAAIAISAATVLVVFISFLIIASRVH